MPVPRPISREEAIPEINKQLREYVLSDPDVRYERIDPGDKHPSGEIRIELPDGQIAYPMGAQEDGLMIDTVLVPYLKGMPTLIPTIEDIRKKHEE